jgi:hypothetical protein
MVFNKRWLSRIFSLFNSRSINDCTAKKYHSVTISYHINQACEAVWQLESRLYLSAKASPLVETKERFLSREAPLLPLAGCTAKYCRCRYVHYEDRRQRERRHFHDQGEAPTLFVGRERRSRIERRRGQ